MTTSFQSIDERAALREFCGPGKKMSRSVIDGIDGDIERAKDSNNHALKKELKRRQVTFHTWLCSR